MLKKHRRPSTIDANTKLPQDLTPLLRAHLNQFPSDRATDYLRECVFSKFVSSETDPAAVRRVRAINKWLATECNNEATNDRLRTYHEEYNILPRVGFARFMAFARDLVNEIMGEVPPDSVLNGAFSGGSSTSRVRTESHPAQKYLGIADATPDLLDFLGESLFDSPLWEDYRAADGSSIRPVCGNVMFTVPKNAEIDRCACKEPDLNMYYQKGIGNFIRHRLKAHGIDLNDQSINQQLARKGSIDRTLATLDLSSASDSIATGLVEMLLPDMWFTLLNACRSKVTTIDGEMHTNEMFSSMGNGFTFELESLIFFVVARATAYFRGIPGIISVYGDDIICPTEIALDLSFVLSCLGFSINLEKSFWEGDFRESCGGHYIDGHDVTPFYVKAPILSLVDVIHVCNSLRKWISKRSSGPILDPTYESLWLELVQYVPLQFWGGHDFADKTRLVTYQSPTRPVRLSARKKRVATGIGGYLHWHDSRSDAPAATALSFAERTVESTTFRRKPVRWSRNSIPEFAFHWEVCIQAERG